MAEILFLAHRIPYPPNKGDKIRSWHFLRRLAATRTVHLGCFVDDPSDWQYEEMLRGICGECHFESIGRSPIKFRNALALADGSPVTLRHYRRPAMSAWVEELIKRRRPDAIFVFSAAMAQYVPKGAANGSRRVIDFVDVDSEKWHQFAVAKQAPMRWVYAREARALDAMERRIARSFDNCIFVSPKEVELFCERAPDCRDKVMTIRNGVDAEQFAPLNGANGGTEVDPDLLVFIGAMDYWPNVDAVTWFADSVLPVVQAVHRGARFAIVGANPTAAVQDLARRPGVSVTGRVDDVRPYLASAACVVAPLRVSQGVPNKILEAMAMAKPVITTSVASAGVDAAQAGSDYLVADSVEDFASSVVRILGERDLATALGENARSRVVKEYDWVASLKQLERLLDAQHQAKTAED